VEASAGLQKQFHEGCGVEGLDHVPIEPHVALHSPIVGLGFVGEDAFAKKDEGSAFGSVAEMELGAEFFGEVGGLQFGLDTEFLKQLAAVREQGFADMEPWKMLLLQEQNATPGASQDGRRSASRRPSTDHDSIPDGGPHGQS